MIILSIFSGRERYIEVLSVYLDRLLAKGLIDVVHMWDYTRNIKDKEYIKKLCKSKAKSYVLMDGKNTSSTWDWSTYYSYYAEALSNEDILIKCDDDVVYVDVDNFGAYIKEIQKGPEGLYFPNIINNDVCAYIQKQYKIHNFINKFPLRPNYRGFKHPLSDWCVDHEAAANVHRDFLQNPSRYSIKGVSNIPWRSRLSINFFGAKGNFIKKVYHDFVTHERHEGDEPYLSAVLCSKFGVDNFVVPFMNVVHFSFHTQKPTLLDIKFLNKYRALVGLSKSIYGDKDYKQMKLIR